MLLAGLICLGAFLSHLGWCRWGISAPARIADAGTIRPQGTFSPVQPAAHQVPAAPPIHPAEAAPKSSASLSWISGGLLAPLLCHYLYGYPLSYVWQEGIWPPGLLDILAAVALVYLGYRQYRRLTALEQPPEVQVPPRFLPMAPETPPLTIREEAKPGVAAIQALDQDFDPAAFGEEVHRLLRDLYAAWNREDISSLAGRVKDSLLEYLQMGLKIMSLREERSYLENMILEGITVTDARVDDGHEFITVCFHGRLLDYVLDRSSGKLLFGSMAYPSAFQEYWDLERPRGQRPWVLRDIRDK